MSREYLIIIFLRGINAFILRRYENFSKFVILNGEFQKIKKMLLSLWKLYKKKPHLAVGEVRVSKTFRVYVFKEN